eukprot:scaffold193_cov139-Amphora_coffeaeformis.AAC.6
MARGRTRVQSARGNYPVLIVAFMAIIDEILFRFDARITSNRSMQMKAPTNQQQLLLRITLPH